MNLMIADEKNLTAVSPQEHIVLVRIPSALKEVEEKVPCSDINVTRIRAASY